MLQCHLLIPPCCRYWSEHPPPTRLSVGEYPRMDAPTPPVGVPDDSWTFWRWNAAANAKFWAISGALKALGQSALATKIWAGWQVRLCPRCSLAVRAPM